MSAGPYFGLLAGIEDLGAGHLGSQAFESNSTVLVPMGEGDGRLEVSRILEIHIEAFYHRARAGKIIGAALIARSIGMKQRMKKSYEKRVAIHSAPSFALAHREVHRKRE
jgi:hypothetical protein